MSALSNTIDTDGLSGDYASFNAALVGEAQDLTDGAGDTWTGICSASTGVADTTNCEVVSWTTAAANWMKWEAATGHEAQKDGIDTNRYRHYASGVMVDIYEDYFYISKIQFVANAPNMMIRVNSVNANNAIYIDSCYFLGTAGVSSEQCIGSIDDDTNYFITNSILSNIAQRCVYLTNGSATIYNCSMRGSNARAGIDSSAGTTVVVKNTAVLNTSDDFSLAGTNTIDYCISDDGDGTNAQTPSGADWDNEFVDSANGDFTALSGNIAGNGIGPSSDASVPTTDIDGTTRSGATCDIGADEIAAGGRPLPQRVFCGPFAGPFNGPF